MQRPLPPMPREVSPHGDGRRTAPHTMPIFIRSANPSARAAVIAFFSGLSRESRHARFFHSIRTLPDAAIGSMLQFEPRRAAALLGYAAESSDDIVAIAQYASGEIPGRCEVAVVVADAWQRRGLARLMLDELAQVASAGGFRFATAETFSDNSAALRLAEHWNASIGIVPGSPQLRSIAVALTAPADAACDDFENRQRTCAATH